MDGDIDKKTGFPPVPHPLDKVFLLAASDQIKKGGNGKNLPASSLTQSPIFFSKVAKNPSTKELFPRAVNYKVSAASQTKQKQHKKDPALRT